MAKKPKSGSGAGAHAEGVDLGEVKRLLAFMQENGIEEFEYERGGVHIRLKKASATPAAAPYVAAAPPVAAVPSPAPVPAPAPAQEAAKPAAAANVHVIKSPIVGTYYSSPSPEAESFVTVGARVEAGQTLCIIEAMKLMNEIESDVAGEVVQVLVENGHPVEYGEPLFRIRTSGKK
ncbi:MAG TPA: acetyl-CoA carboxylase biotin carboxyl carrier protein [Candidatus Acidoferrales bacterium]|jgi:acetyl-CoA carboxylase biotin carboxyl carrier protein|nr:acetyl-CoA carboxylase biotin carboxyl carrier protein [Candidatus Acidoferrales bacterium]